MGVIAIILANLPTRNPSGHDAVDLVGALAQRLTFKAPSATAPSRQRLLVFESLADPSHGVQLPTCQVVHVQQLVSTGVHLDSPKADECRNTPDPLLAQRIVLEVAV